MEDCSLRTEGPALRQREFISDGARSWYLSARGVLRPGRTVGKGSAKARPPVDQDLVIRSTWLS